MCCFVVCCVLCWFVDVFVVVCLVLIVLLCCVCACLVLFVLFALSLRVFVVYCWLDFVCYSFVF